MWLKLKCNNEIGYILIKEYQSSVEAYTDVVALAVSSDTFGNSTIESYSMTGYYQNIIYIRSDIIDYNTLLYEYWVIVDIERVLNDKDNDNHKLKDFLKIYSRNKIIDTL